MIALPHSVKQQWKELPGAVQEEPEKRKDIHEGHEGARRQDLRN